MRLATLGAALAVTGAAAIPPGDRSDSGDLIGPRHRTVQRLRRLARRRSARTEEAAYVVDGPTLLDEALRAGTAIDEVVAEPGAPQELLDRAVHVGATVRLARPGTLARATETVQPQPVAAIARFDADPEPVERALDGLAGDALVVVLVGVNDPGNAGTVLRSAEAAGAELVVFADGSVDPYNPKCVRGSAGALFRLRTVRDVPAADALAALRQRGQRCLGLVAHDGVCHDQVDLASAVALVLGSEAHGLPAEIGRQLDGRVTIPMGGEVESLNVAMAATVVCFEAQRQRRDRKPNGLDAATGADAGCSAA